MLRVQDVCRSTGWPESTRSPACRFRSPLPRPQCSSTIAANVSQLFRLDDREQLGARVGKVFAQMIDHRLAGPLHLGLEQIGHQRHAAAAAGAGLGAAFHRVDRVELPARESPRKSLPWSRCCTSRSGPRRASRRRRRCRRRRRSAADDQFVRLARQRRVALGEHRQRAVVARHRRPGCRPAAACRRARRAASCRRR